MAGYVSNPQQKKKKKKKKQLPTRYEVVLRLTTS